MIRPSPLAEQVYAHLLQMILAKELTQGDALHEVELSARLGVSRTPIRQALTRLAEHGVVELRPNRGASVRRIGRDEVTHFHQVREALEGMAAELSCGRLTGADFDRLDALAMAAGDDRSPDYFNAFNRYDFGLHRLIAERSGNPTLAREIRRFHELTTLISSGLEEVLLGRHQINEIDQRELRRIGVNQHVEIVDALRSGNPSGSREAMVRHVRASCALKVGLLSPQADPMPSDPGDEAPPIPGVDRVVTR